MFGLPKEDIKSVARCSTYTSLALTTDNIVKNYMLIYDEYYETCSRDSAFLKDLVDSLMGIDAVLSVYTRDKKIHPAYALEKLRNSKSYIEENISYFKNKLNELEGEK